MGRPKANIHYIYKTTCVVTGRYYIGMHSTSNLNDGYLGSGKKLRHSIRKYGKENHHKEILEFLESRELLVEREKAIVTLELIQDDKCMNLGLGGTGGFLTEGQKLNCCREGNKAFTTKLKTDKEFYEEWKRKLSESVRKTYESGNHNHVGSSGFTGMIHSEYTKQLMSKAKVGRGLGETNSQYGTCWITKNGINKKIKKETLNLYVNEGWIKGRK
jgi:hypothetical protein